MVHDLAVESRPRVGPSAVATPARYRMPTPTLGTVMWANHDRSGGECYAIITAVYQNCLDLMVFPSNIHLPQPKLGVKHAGDPTLEGMKSPNPGGVWDFCPGEARLVAIIDRQAAFIDELLAARRAADAAIVGRLEAIESVVLDPTPTAPDDDGTPLGTEPDPSSTRRSRKNGA